MTAARHERVRARFSGAILAAGAAISCGGSDGGSGLLPQPIPVDDFTLIERSGRKVTKQDLLGKVWIADFIFTRCPGPCPVLTRGMTGLARELPEEVRFVSFSVDPTFDTPEVLTSFADGVGADAERWLFLTGEKREVIDTLRENFLATVEEEPGGGIAHSLRFILVDRAGRIRGLYNGTEEDDVRKVRRDARRLLDERP